MSDNPEHILIIDDDKFLSDMYALKFREANYTADVITSGQEGLSFIEEHADNLPDLILLDLVMPDLNGFDLLKEAQSRGILEKTTVVVLSNQSREGDIQKAEEAGVKGYIVKASAIPSEVVRIALEMYRSDHVGSILVKH